MSFYKYGPVKINFGKKLVHAVKTAIQCIEKYEKTGNTEYLCDAANYLMFEFMYPQIPNAHFKSTTSEESAGLVGTAVNQIMEEVEK